MSSTYALTELGKLMVRRGEGLSPEDMRVLQYIKDNKAATSEELDVVAERWKVKGLKSQGYIKELTLSAT